MSKLSAQGKNSPESYGRSKMISCRRKQNVTRPLQNSHYSTLFLLVYPNTDLAKNTPNNYYVSFEVSIILCFDDQAYNPKI
ncbi:hypothetical protein M514_11235 [Trichuris suis]|uniref:Uncharacterized protein n=1 Tax=Trichuris suis TaxID=68888 RepID=A0A085LSD6_9BILA|nr:hypothetical protein M513_11235 [Trichuris suis]KFD64632.1 hypothetical protein M514_11235 [Trichuris suis]